MDQSDYRKRVARAALPRPTPYEAIVPSNATGDSRPATDDDQRPRQLTRARVLDLLCTTDSEAQLPRN